MYVMKVKTQENAAHSRMKIGRKVALAERLYGGKSSLKIRYSLQRLLVYSDGCRSFT
jgi:hypothetical protein